MTIPSVHICEYPVAIEWLIDRQLSDDMDALFKIVALGSQARNNVKIKVRQPLAELKVAGFERTRRAVARFRDQICEELNIKKVTWYDLDGNRNPLLKLEIKPNPKKLGPKVGGKLHEVQEYCRKLALEGKKPCAEFNTQNPSESFWVFDLPSGQLRVLEDHDDFFAAKVSPDSGWAPASDLENEVLLDTRITPELELEGLAREIVRHVQNARKEAELEMDDRIILVLETEDAKMKEAIRAHRDYIANETLVVNWATEPLGGLSHRVDVKIEGMKLVIELKKQA